MKCFSSSTAALAVAFLVSALSANAQTEGGSFTIVGHGIATPFATDYQCLGINPANLDLASRYEGKRFAIGGSELGISLYSEALTKSEIRKNLFGGNFENLSQEEQRNLAIDFANSNNAADVDVLTFGFAAQTTNAGSFAFSSRERVDYFSQLGPQVSELLWLGYNAPYFEQLILANGDTIPNTENIDQATLDQVVQGITAVANAQNLSQLLQGTQFRMTWIREFNLGYGKRLIGNENWEWHAGIGGKFLVGQGILDIQANNGQAVAFSALSPVFSVNYDDLATNNPSALDDNARKLTPVGWGWGVDIGTTFFIKEKYLISAAVTDIGSMKWSGNVYGLNDIELTDFQTGGIENVDFLEQVEQLNGTDGILDWKGEESVTTALPSQLRLGFGAYLGKKIKLGVDVVQSMNDEVGSIDKAVIALGGEFSPMPWLHLSMGVMQGGNYDTKIPAGIVFSSASGSYECGIASRDMITFFTEDAPTVSASLGFLRFRF